MPCEQEVAKQVHDWLMADGEVDILPGLTAYSGTGATAVVLTTPTQSFAVRVQEITGRP